MTKKIILLLCFFVVGLITRCADEKSDPPVDLVVTFTNTSFQPDLTSILFTTTLIKNTGTVSEKGFLIGESAGLTIAASQKLLNLSGALTYSAIAHDLIPGTTYFARPFAIVDDEEFMGDEFEVSTSTPTYTLVSPLEAGRGQRVQITGAFLTSNQADVSILVGGLEATILSYTASNLEILIPENIEIGSEAAIALTINGYNLSVSETITISRWSILKKAPFNSAIASDITYSYALGGKLYYPSSEDIYDPATDSWVNDSGIANGAFGFLNYPIDFTIGNKGYLGFSDPTKKFYEFNAQLKVWTELNTFPGTGHNFLYGVWTSNGIKGYYGLGYNVVASVTTGLKEFWEYNPANNVWTRLEDYPGTAITDGVSFAINEYIFVGGGYYREGVTTTFKPEFFAYNTINENWTQVADFPITPPSARFKKAVVVGSKAYFFIRNSIWEYDFESNTWDQRDDEIPGATNRASYDVLVSGNAIYIATGIGDVAGSTVYVEDFYKWYPQD